MANSGSRRWLIFAGIILGLLLLGAAAVYFLGGSQVVLPFLSPPPTILIVEPAGDVSIYSGQGIHLSAVGVSDGGFDRIDLYLDGELIQSHRPGDSSQPTFHSHFVWFATDLGAHELSVRAVALGGASSEPSGRRVNVFARQAPEVDGQPSNEDLGQAPVDQVSLADSLEAESSEAGNANGEQPQDAGQGADGGEGENADPQGEPAVDAPNQPEQANDNPPRLTAFEYDLNIVGNEVVATIGAAADDDLGVDRVEFLLVPRNGVTISFVQICAGRLSCEVGGESVLPPGEWLLSAQAFDISGQASEPELLLAEVLGEAGEPPAAAEHDFDFSDQLPDLSFDEDFPLLPGNLGQGFDVDDFLGERFPDSGGEPVENVGNCATISLVQDGNAVELSATVTCDLQAVPDHFLYVNAGQGILHQGAQSRSLHIQDWFDEGLMAISAGTSFETRIERVQCGATYEFSFRVDDGSIVDGGQWDGHLGIGGTQAFVSQEIRISECDRGVSDINLQVLPAGPLSLRATWSVAPNGAWPENIGEEGVTFYLMRFQDQTEELVVIDAFDLTKEQLLAGRDFSLVDDRLLCGTQYWYSVVVHLVNQQQPRFATPIIQPSVFSPGLECPGDELASVEMTLTQYWDQHDNLSILIEAAFPANYAWPLGDDVELRLNTILEGEGCRAPCQDGWHYGPVVSVTDMVRGQNYVFEEVMQPRCGGSVYQFRFAVTVAGAIVDAGPIQTVTSEPCPPLVPDILSIHAMTQGCPNGAPYCVRVTWEPYRDAQREGYATSAAYLILERDNTIGESTTWRLPVNATEYMDTNPTAMIGNLCSVPEMYRIFAYDENDRHYGASPLQIRGLRCGERWDVISEARR
jgi:hypothetical protein